MTIDDDRAATDMTQQLIGLGHRRIGFIVGNSNQTASRKRLEGFRRAMQQAGLCDDPALIVEGDFSYRSGLRAAEQLLDLLCAANRDFRQQRRYGRSGRRDGASSTFRRA